AQTTLLLVEPPWRPAVLWERVTLTCQGLGTTSDTTWYKDGQCWGQEGLENFTVTETGTYMCDRPSTGRSPTVRASYDWLVLQVPARPLLEGDTVTLHCRGWKNRSVTQVQFCHGDEEVSRSPNRTELSLSPLQLHHSGDYHCRGRVYYEVSGSWVQHKSAPVTVIVHVPVANATITPGPLSHQVHTGDPVTLRCSVQVGSAPVNFTWLRNNQDVAWGPVLELGDIDVGHSGTYQCMATNQLGQDGHCVFRALSPELALEVTPGSPWVTGPPRATSPQVTYAELPGPHRRQRDPSDIYGNIL
ncbi:hypothetical protein HGM15179_021618, partial [Zosterops borbonicus]